MLSLCVKLLYVRDGMCVKLLYVMCVKLLYVKFVCEVIVCERRYVTKMCFKFVC